MDFQSIKRFYFPEQCIFYSGLIFKIFCAGGGALGLHSIAESTFIPFLKYFINSGFQNPYQHFIQIDQGNVFPYPAIMLYITALPQWLLGPLAPNSYWWPIFLFKIPLLAADLGIFFILKSWLKGKKGKVILFYWLSPVLIYISYFYGQLDAIPICLLFVGLFFLFRESFILSAIFMGLALAAKTNILLSYPFLFLYLMKKTRWQSIIFFFVTAILVFAVCNIFYITDRSFLQMVLLNQEQNKIFQLSFPLGQFNFYFIPAGLLFLFAKGLSLKTYNRDIFMMFLGFAFSILLVFIAPPPGWYFWIIPFFVYFYIYEESLFFYLFLFFQAVAVIYFVLFQVYETSSFVGSVVFTLLQALLMVNCFLIYRRGLGSYSRHKITSSPFLIGIGGNSGVGKTFLSQGLLHVFRERNTLILRGDDHHKWQRNDENWENITQLDPRANYLHSEITTLKKLKKMQKISRRTYNHDTGCFTEENILSPKSIIILEGLHPFYLKAQRDLYDLKIFIRPETQLEQHWKIVRDKKERGYSEQTVWDQIKKRGEDRKKFILTQSKYADILVRVIPEKPICHIGNEAEEPQIYLIVELSNSVFMDPVLDMLSTMSGLHIEHGYEAEDKQKIKIRGYISSKNIAYVAQILIPGLQDIGIDGVSWPAGCFGVLLLIIVYYIFEEADRE